MSDTADDQLVKAEDVKNEKSDQFQVRIDLPPAPHPDLVSSKGPDDGNNNLAIVLFCTATESLHDIKSIITELEGFWLGAFQFQRVDDDAPLELLSEWQEIGAVFADEKYHDLTVPRVLKIVEVSFNESEARSHVMRTHDILRNLVPGMQARQSCRPPAYDPNTFAIDSGLSLFTSIRDSVYGSKTQEQQSSVVAENTPEQPKSKSKKSKKGSKKEPAQPQTNGVQEHETADDDKPHAFSDWTPNKDPTSAYVKRRMELAARPRAPDCVKTFALSPWNPPPQHLRLRGHLLYLYVVTLEGEYYHITSSTSGFFVDKSDSGHFDPTLRQGKAGTDKTFTSLFGLLAALSPKFVTVLKSLLAHTASLNPDSYTTATITNTVPASPWIVPEPVPTSDPMRSQTVQQSMCLTLPDCAPTAREWNEEFLMIRELPRTSVQERLTRERLMARTQAEMGVAAARAVVGVVHGDIIPANPHEPAALHTVIHGNLLLVPARDAYDNLSHLGGEEAVKVMVGKDVVGARVLHALDIEGVNFSPSVVVDYMGQRWLAQTVLPGLLSGAKADPEPEPETAEQADSEPKALEDAADPDTPSKQGEFSPGFHVVYGGTDIEHPEKHYAAHPTFHNLANKIAKQLHIAEHQVHDTEGKPTTLWLSGDMKGVIGQDGNNYFIDLFRLYPVDVCFLEQDVDGELYHNPSIPASDLPSYDAEHVRYPHRLAMLRPELLDAYRETQLRSWIYAQIAEQNSKKESTSKASAVEQRENETEEEAKQRAELETLVDTFNQPQTVININEFEFNYDVDAYVDRRNPQGGVPTNEDDPSVKHVREASSHVRGPAVISFLGESINNGTLPVDGFALTKLLHARGFSMRHLGLIASKATVKNLEVPEKHVEFATQSLKLLVASLEREMVVRSAKHVLRRFLERREQAEAAPCISHFLNCLLGASFNPRPACDTSSLLPSHVERPWTKLTPESVRELILVEIARRFRYRLLPSYFETALPKLQVLRELVLRCGIQMLIRDYVFEKDVSSNGNGEEAAAVATKNDNGKTKKVPTRERLTTFEPEDVACVYPVTKDLTHKSVLADELFDQGTQQIGQGNIAIGEGLVSDALNYYEQIFGNVHQVLATRYHELAVTYHQLSLPLMKSIGIYESSKEATEEVQTKARAESGIESDEALEQAKRELKGFVESAVNMNRQSIIMAERTLGVDHHVTLQQYIDLAILEHANGDVRLGLELTKHAIEIADLIYGPDHSDAARAAMNAAQMLVQWKGHGAGVPLFKAAAETSARTRGPTAIVTANNLSALANAQALAGDLHASKETAKEAAQVFALRLGKDDEKTVEADNLYEVLTKAVLNKERGEQAKLGRLARRLGLNEERAKQLLERGNVTKTPTKTVNTSSKQAAVAATHDKENKPAVNGAISQMNLDDLVKFVQGTDVAPSSRKGKGVDKRH